MVSVHAVKHSYIPKLIHLCKQPQMMLTYVYICPEAVTNDRKSTHVSSLQ